MVPRKWFLLSVAGKLFGGYDSELKGFTEFTTQDSVNPRNSMSYLDDPLLPQSLHLPRIIPQSRKHFPVVLPQ